MPRRPASPSPATEARFTAAQAAFNRGETDAALAAFRALGRHRDPEIRRRALGKVASYAPASPAADNAAILAARREWTTLESPAAGSPDFPTPRRPAGRPLRIGYVSAFFACRNWMKPVWGVLRAHDRRAFEVHLFIEGGLPDRRHGYVPDARDHVHPIDDLSNLEAARRVAAAGIDILIDLNAYSWARRLGLFLLRPARIQLGWFNTMATSGTTAFDYAVADRVTLPANEERFCTEKILRVRGSYLAFSVSYRVPPLVPPPSQKTGRLTFGCLAPHYKITPQVVETFAAILRQAPSARLFLKNTALDDPGNRAALLAQFQAQGVDAAQLGFAGFSDHYAFLQAYNRVDIALDTFPYSGGTTTMEAVWQGVPVLTFRGDRWCARTSASLLEAAGLGDWVCPSRRAFIARAVALGQNPPRWLAARRKQLRRKVAGSAAGDSRGLCRQLERHYATLGRRRPQGERGAT